MIELLCEGKSASVIEREYKVAHATILRWAKSFVSDGLFNNSELTEEEIVRLEKLREEARKILELIKKANREYDNDFKYKMIELLCDGRSAKDIQSEYEVADTTISKWLKSFVSDGLFDNSELTEEEIVRLEKLREKTRRTLEMGKFGGKYGNRFKYKMIELLCEGKSVKKLASESEVSEEALTKWLKSFVTDGPFDNSELTEEEIVKLEKLREKASRKLDNQRKYDNDFKYKMIKLLCDGRSAKDIQREYKVANVTLSKWLKSFVSDGPFDNSELIEEEIVKLEKLREVATRRQLETKNYGKNYDNSFKYKMIALLCDGKSVSELERDYELSNATIRKWLKSFVSEGPFDNSELTEEEIVKLEKLRVVATRRQLEMGKLIRYDNRFKYKMIKLLCGGKSSPELGREYEISGCSPLNWLKSFVSNGPFDLSELTEVEIVKLENLRVVATRRQLEITKSGQSKDVTFMWVLELDKDLELWRTLAEEWLETQTRGKSEVLAAFSKFFQEYLSNLNIPRVPGDFLKREYSAPDFYEIIYAQPDHKTSIRRAKKIIIFIDWILLGKFSVEDDYGNRHIPAEFHNPLTKFIPDGYVNSKLNESDKNVLPYRYIKKLRSILCPVDAIHFKDWHFAHEASDSKVHGGDWFVFDKLLIDENDPDCVFRKRETSKYERDKEGLPDEVYELWSPAVSVALLTKLLLPLRTFQVRMLDSGEMDTFKYVQPERAMTGHWVENNSPLSKGDKNNPFEKGVLRKFNDPISKRVMTGFYISTNKTADINKAEDQKGYEIPWEYEEVQYWLAKLRDWQQKYNPLDKPTPWTDLTSKHLRQVKDNKILKQMGSTTFLFRNSSADGEEHLPISDNTIGRQWHKTLTELENQLKLHGATEEERSIRFIKNKVTTLYPLHSLRVSLITAYALEGGVPMPILSKAIAGHARLVMTLYYTKAGISYVTDQMNQAEQNILENDKASFKRFLRDAKYEQLKTNVATNDPVAYQTVINAQHSGAGLIIGDKGICPRGCFGCENGGVFVNDETSSATFGPVPGFPEQNCVRCRWFVTGPAFLTGLVHHFNTIGYNMGETGKRVIEFQNEIEKLENIKYECEENEQIFTDHIKLLKFESLFQQEIQKNDKFANDYNATLRLIDKCMTIAKNKPSEEGFQLVTAGAMSDIGLTLTSVEHELEQLQVLCNGAEIFPETDAGKAILQRSQIIDLTLARNDKKPIMFSLTEEEQLIAGNQFMILLMHRAGSLKDAVPYAVGRKKLEEIGLLNEFTEEIKSYKLDGPTLLLEHDNIIQMSNII